MAIVRLCRISLFALWLAAWGEAQVLWGRQSPPPVPLTAAQDQLPPRRGFAPLPINDLRGSGTSIPPGNQPSTPSEPIAPLHSEFPPANPAGTTSGMFLPPSAGPGPSGTAVPAPRERTGSAAAGGNPAGQSAPGQSSSSLPEGTLSRPLELIPDPPIQDLQVQPAAGTGPGLASPDRIRADPSGQASDWSAQILGRYDLRTAIQPLPGQPLRLQAALQVSAPEQRRSIVRQYWLTYGAWADYLNRCDHCEYLGGIQPGPAPGEDRLLEASRRLAEGERLEAELRLNWAQCELSRLLPSAGSEVLPLPADRPLVQAYETHAQWYIANGAMPPGIQTIARNLPRQLALIQHRAMTAELALQGMHRPDFQARGQAMEMATKLALSNLAQQAQQAWLQSVLEYNQWIAEYALSLAPIRQTPEAIAAMLVGPPKALSETSPSVLVQGGTGWMEGAPPQAADLANRPSASVLLPAGSLAPRQPVERVSGVEPASGPERPPTLVVAPAISGAEPLPRSGSGSGTGLASPGPEQRPALTPAGGDFGSTGSFAPPPSIPNFGSSPTPESRPPGAAPQSGAGFKFGG